MTRSNSVQKLCAAALLIAVGTLIPIVSPVKIPLPTMSFTLASHVAIFIAMMISPPVAVAVAVGTTFGFVVAGFPILVVLRAASHVVFAFLGAVYLQKKPSILDKPMQFHLFSFVIGIIHALCEVVVVTIFFFQGRLADASYQQGFVTAVLLLVGVGSLIHSMVDLEISYLVAKVLGKQKGFSLLLTYKPAAAKR